MRRWTSLCLAGSVAAAVAGPASGEQLLDVPFVSQTELLCGGAAAAMVMRFWGDANAGAEDFAAIVHPHAGGIRLADLQLALVERGWQALPFTGGLVEASHQLERGRPVLALIRADSNRLHYVVLVGRNATAVVLHDPAHGPFRVRDRREFEAAWQVAQGNGLLILPARFPFSRPPEPAPSNRDSLPAAPDWSPTAALDGCEALVARGVRWARGGDLDAADSLLEVACSVCPRNAAAWRERAGVRFQRGRWASAAGAGERAARLDPSDEYAWELVATSRYLDGDAEAALNAWNRVRAPRIDRTRIDGLQRTRYGVVDEFLELPPGGLLTEANLRRARRRLASFPASQRTHIEYQPLSGGVAHVQVQVYEPGLARPDAAALGVIGARALFEREFHASVASPTGNGERWSGAIRWWENRPAVQARLDLPAAWGAGSVWHLETQWERQSYHWPQLTIRSAERRRGAVGLSQWATADRRWNLGVAFERWKARGSDVGMEAGIEHRLWRDRAALRWDVKQAWNVAGAAPYSRNSLHAAWRSSVPGDPNALKWAIDAGIVGASPSTPLLAWPTAGNGGEFPLRAHSLFDAGVLTGKGFGRQLAHASFEVQIWPWQPRVVKVGFAAFVDTARPGFAPAGAGLLADAGAGLRVRLPSRREQLRLDFARSWTDGEWAVSAGLDLERLFEE